MADAFRRHSLSAASFGAETPRRISHENQQPYSAGAKSGTPTKPLHPANSPHHSHTTTPLIQPAPIGHARSNSLSQPRIPSQGVIAGPPRPAVAVATNGFNNVPTHNSQPTYNQQMPTSQPRPGALKLKPSPQQMLQNSAPSPTNHQQTTHSRQSSLQLNGLHAAESPNPPAGLKHKRGKSGNSLSITQKASMVASRAFRSNVIPFSLREQLETTPCMWADQPLAEKHISDVWMHYDVDVDGTLNKQEMTKLAADLVDQWMITYRKQIQQQRPGISLKDAEATVRKDFAQLMPCKEMEETKRHMIDRLTRELDIDRDGVVTKTEFQVQWPRSCKNFLTVKKQESIGCSVQ